MIYIKYGKYDGWSDGEANSYGNYFLSKLNTLRNAYSLESYKQSKIFCGKINDRNIELDLSELAKGANRAIKNSGFIEKAQGLGQEVINNMNKTGDAFKKFSNNAEEIVKIRSGLVDGFTFEVDSGNIPKLDGKILQAFQDQHSLSNVVGKLGESMSSATGAAMTSAIKAEIEKQLPKGAKIVSGEASYTNVGNQYQGSYRSQTDNRLNVAFKIDNNGKTAELKLSLNISDKLNSSFIKTKNKKTTGRLNLRNSTVSHLMEPGEESATYNLISYHNNNGHRISYMYRKPGLALRSYYGYKMLQEMLTKSIEYKDKIQFTVYGGRAIPESNVIDKMLSQTKNGRYRYQAEIRYWQLKNAKIKNELEAQDIINSMPVQIGESFSLDI